MILIEPHTRCDLAAERQNTMANRIITISRQFGSGGRTIGRLLSEKLGIPCYDNELIEKLAQESGFDKNYIAEQGEYTAHSNWFVNAFSTGRSSYPTNQDYLWKIQRQIILDLAEQSPCIIVGRCAEYILAEHPDLIRVFVRGEKDARIARITAHLNVTEKEAAAMMAKTDKKRASYHDFYSDDRWGAAASYDIIVNSSRIGIDNAVDMIAQYVENR